MTSISRSTVEMHQRLQHSSMQRIRQPLQQTCMQRSYSSSTLPASSKSKGKFNNLRDSVKKSPTRSTAKVKATSGWWSDGSWSNYSFVKV